MTSKEINDRIDELSLRDDRIYESILGEKLIPYIGWFWRTVDFDKDYCWLGIIPNEGNSGAKKPLIGFMVNNKWDYDSIKVHGDLWTSIKDAIITAILSENPEDFKYVDELIQSACEN